MQITPTPLPPSGRLESPVLIQYFIGAVFALVTGVLAYLIGAALWRRWTGECISVKRITRSDDGDINGLIDLYTKLFSKQTSDYTADDVLSLIQDQSHGPENRPNRSEDFILVAKYHGEVVGFVFCHYYPDRKNAIISYYGIDKEVTLARQTAAKLLLEKTRKLLTSGNRDCRFLFFDVERPHRNLAKPERIERESRIRRLRQTARSFHLRAYSLDFDYHSPRITMADGTRETPLTLLVVPIKDSLGSSISRDKLIVFLRFIYLDCYGDIYELSDPHYTAYHAHLNERLMHYEKTLPKIIAIK